MSKPPDSGRPVVELRSTVQAEARTYKMPLDSDCGNWNAVISSDDPRVDPWMPGKMTARLQAATNSGKPVLLRVDYGGGHGLGTGATAVQESLADTYSFLLWQFSVPEFQPLKK